MKVSVLVPVYNVSLFLHRFLASLWQQTYKDVEFIFCDDCSIDNSYEILLSEISTVGLDCKVIKHKKNEGIAQTRNDLLKASSGEYVVFVDSDDWIDSDYIEQLVLASDGYDIVQCGYYEERYDRQVRFQARKAVNYTELLSDLISVKTDTFLWTKLIKRSLFHDFVFFPGINHGEDYLACIWIYAHTSKIHIIDKSLYHYNRTNSTSITRDNDYIKFVKLFDKAEALLSELKLLPEYQTPFNRRIFMFKKDLILNGSPRWDVYLRYRPDVNDYWRGVPLGSINKVIFFFLEKRMVLLSKIVFLLKSI